MKKAILAVLLAAVLLTGCVPGLGRRERRYSATFLDLFDTVTTVVGYDSSEEAFQTKAQMVYEELLQYHRLFDIYNTYDGLNNLKTVNDNAGKKPVTVEPAVVALLKDCKAYYTLTGGKVNVVMGSVLSLWHEARTQALENPAAARLPEKQALAAAGEHTDIGSLVIDEEASTVFLTDGQASLDVGAVAKGWAVQRAAEKAPAGLLISVGGNVYATGPKPEDTPWTIGIQNPAGEGTVRTLQLAVGTVVTSGDYQRTYTVAGKQYHHIIDPQTRMPGAHWRSVSVVCGDSALADALSTALFLLPLEQGRELAKSCNAEVLWIDGNMEQFMTENFPAMRMGSDN